MTAAKPLRTTDGPSADPTADAERHLSDPRAVAA
jgi:hypothetical protein